jgi:hypothetical protein
MQGFATNLWPSCLAAGADVNLLPEKNIVKIALKNRAIIASQEEQDNILRSTCSAQFPSETVVTDACM